METTKERMIPKSEHKKVRRPQQDGYEIVLSFQEVQDDTDKPNKVKQIWLRFGTFEGNGNHKWETTMAIEHVDPEAKEVSVMVDVDQLPTSADSCYYQLLCEIDNEHGEPEIFLTEPTSLQNTN